MTRFKVLTPIFIGTLLLFAGCTGKDPYPGFSKSPNGVYFRLLEIGEGQEKALPGDYLTIDIKYKTTGDSIFFSGRRKLQVTPSEYKGSIDECFLMLSTGDRAEFVLNSNDFFSRTLGTSVPLFLPEEGDFIVDMDVLEIQQEADYRREKEAFLSWIEDFGEYERVLLKQYFEKEKMEIEPVKEGLYYISLQEGSGKKIEVGDTLVVHYEGRFLDGKFFDSTVKRNEPFQFVFGQQWQVIKGLETALGYMKGGDRAIVILPSGLAWGETGSSTGIIPPYTSLVFEVEVISVNSSL